MNLAEIERAKYAQIWSTVPDYRNYSPGAENVQRFLDVLNPESAESVLDIGCGTGIAGVELAKRGLHVCWLDITDAGLLPEVPRGRFLQAPLWSHWTTHWRHGFAYGFCCDVMEHIPTEYSTLVVDRIVSACRTTWFQIALVPDVFGATIGQPLHLTVKPFGWWLERLRIAGDVIDARDLCEQALFVVRRK